jgi:benzodiazapine receptor
VLAGNAGSTVSERRAGLRSGLALGFFLLVCFAVAAFGAQFEPGQWYERLVKPAWTPPNWMFPPVWTLLYAAIAVSGWLAWRAAGFRGARAAWLLYGTQLLLNGAWSWLFFGLHLPAPAFAEIVALWVAILGTLVAFARLSAPAAILLIPYLAWVSFAALLNGALWWLNPQ